jgi:hypothetical protein
MTRATIVTIAELPEARAENVGQTCASSINPLRISDNLVHSASKVIHDQIGHVDVLARAMVEMGISMVPLIRF